MVEKARPATRPGPLGALGVVLLPLLNRLDSDVEHVRHFPAYYKFVTVRSALC
jgi:hypothetical protein